MGCMVTWLHGYMVAWLHELHGVHELHARFTFHVSLHELQGEGGEPGFEVGVGVAIRSWVFMQG